MRSAIRITWGCVNVPAAFCERRARRVPLAFAVSFGCVPLVLVLPDGLVALPLDIAPPLIWTRIPVEPPVFGDIVLLPVPEGGVPEVWASTTPPANAMHAAVAAASRLNLLMSILATSVDETPACQSMGQALASAARRTGNARACIDSASPHRRTRALPGARLSVGLRLKSAPLRV